MEVIEEEEEVDEGAWMEEVDGMTGEMMMDNLVIGEEVEEGVTETEEDLMVAVEEEEEEGTIVEVVDLSEVVADQDKTVHLCGKRNFVNHLQVIYGNICIRHV